MKKFIWRIKLTFCLFKYHAMWYHFVKTFKWTKEDCWIDFYNDGYSPKEAIKEDISNC